MAGLGGGRGGDSGGETVGSTLSSEPDKFACVCLALGGGAGVVQRQFFSADGDFVVTCLVRGFAGDGSAVGTIPCPGAWVPVGK